jgi:uncharacterized protein YbjT (DUF2867 family)
MANRPIILVIGATGAQGGSVAYHLLSGGKFTVRCLTRNPNLEKALKLKEAGAEVLKGELEDGGGLQTAMAGCHGVFGVTNYWEHFDKEYQQGKNLVDAVAAAKVSHFVFSTLPYASKISNGTLKVPHFDTKGQLEEYARGLSLPVTFVHVAFYFENFLSYLPPQKKDDGTYAFGFPQGDTPLAGVAVADIGGVVVALFDRPREFLNKTVGIVGDDLPSQQYANIMTRVLGKMVVYDYIPREVFASFNFPGAEDLANMFEFNRLYIPNRAADLAESRLLYPKMQTFESWLRTNAQEFERLLS